MFKLNISSKVWIETPSRVSTRQVELHIPQVFMKQSGLRQIDTHPSKRPNSKVYTISSQVGLACWLVPTESLLIHEHRTILLNPWIFDLKLVMATFCHGKLILNLISNPKAPYETRMLTDSEKSLLIHEHETIWSIKNSYQTPFQLRHSEKPLLIHET